MEECIILSNGNETHVLMSSTEAEMKARLKQYGFVQVSPTRWVLHVPSEVTAAKQERHFSKTLKEVWTADFCAASPARTIGDVIGHVAQSAS